MPRLNNNKRLPELLAPAGSPLALDAAIDGGADAIYMGAVGFNARVNAKNFTSEELGEGIARAHAYGKKIYLTLNTQVYDRELDEALFVAEDAYLRGADALIVADVGLASEISRRIPIELHGSTQMSGHNVAAADLLERAGFSRMVLAREMSREDILDFCARSPIEAEVFVHGALCVCHSGQCLFSSIVGGRSGNRGECAQPCRLPFTDGRGRQSYPLSLKDLSLSRHIPELIEGGVASFKIEGRMKSPEYVREVTAVWRRLIDEGRAAEPKEEAYLAEIFSRGGFTDGYYTGRVDRKMLGVRSEGDKQTTRELEPFSKIEKKIPISLSAILSAGEPMEVVASLADGRDISVSYSGGEVMKAMNAPLDRETVVRCLSKLGNTEFSAVGVDVELRGEVMLPISMLNGARRAVTELLSAELVRCAGERTREDIKKAEKQRPTGTRIKSRAAVFYDPRSIPEAAYEYFDIIYLPLERFGGECEGVLLPPVIFDSEREEVRKMLLRAVELGARHALIGNIGHVELARECGLIPHGNIGLNVCNSSSAAAAERLGFADTVLSPELTLARMRDVGGASYAVVYGRLPLMVTEKCVGRELGSCEDCTAGRLSLRDRRGVEFPVLRGYSHRSLIFNSVPVYMADRENALGEYGIGGRFFIFTTESSDEAEMVIEAYKKGTPPRDAGAVRRIK